ncbi:MAG TPA: GNAT family N-acetyltransferase [Solirubrobacteraceae bacterium]|nr:GNAT family N-acetyltransferase [Solirubrobacteraceae bacterium]
MPAEARTTRTPEPAPGLALDPLTRLARAHAARAEMFTRAAERVVRLDWGSAIFHDDFPRWPDLNTVRVEVPAPALDAERLERAVERLQARLALQRIEVFDEETATRLRHDMDARGWWLQRSVLMGWDAGEPPPAPEVEEVPYAAIEKLRAEWLRSDVVAGDEEALAQGLAADRLTFSRTPTRAFAAIRAGRPVAYGLLLDVGDTALVEDVYTTPAARGAGLGAAVVHRLVFEGQAGAHADTVLATDAAGRARGLYARLGFARIGAVQRFLRRVG